MAFPSAARGGASARPETVATRHRPPRTRVDHVIPPVPVRQWVISAPTCCPLAHTATLRSFRRSIALTYSGTERPLGTTGNANGGRFNSTVSNQTERAGFFRARFPLSLFFREFQRNVYVRQRLVIDDALVGDCDGLGLAEDFQESPPLAKASGIADVGPAVRRGQNAMMLVCQVSSLPRPARPARVHRTWLGQTD